MPPRIARASTAAAASAAKKGPKSKNKNQRRALNAYASAARQIPESRINRNRLGEDLDDGPKKRKRVDDDDEDDDEDDDVQHDDEEVKKVAKRRRGIADDDDAVEHGSDSSGNEWTLGGLGDDNDDSDLDSDEAFGESDEERFQGFTFRGSSTKGGKRKRKTVGKKTVDLDESDEDEIDDGDSQDDVGETFGEDGVDLATMLDDDDDEEEDMTKNVEESDSGSESGEEEEDSSSADDDDYSDDEEAVARNMDRISNLDPTSRSSVQQSEGITTVDDFMDSTITPLAPLPSKKKKKSKTITPLAAKLPKRQQDRIDREIASEKAKEQLTRWQDTVKRNRREEFLTFPLQDPTDQSGITGKEKFLPAAQQVPQNELEASIQRIMEESGLASAHKGEGEGAAEQEQALLKAEELATNKLPVEEVLRRRAELRKMRELLFREEIKAKRIAKIKSKTYRRVHRKERERLAEQEKQAMEGLGEYAMDEDEKEKQDRRRAEARMGTKHKDSKWAKSLKATGRAVWDEGARDGVVEQARREEELKKRIEGRDVSGSDGEGNWSPSDDDSDDESEGDAVFRLRKLNGESGAPEKKGLAGMKFMRDAEERKQRANDEDVARLRKELAVEDGEQEDSEEGEESLGRALFGPKTTNTSSQPKEQRLEFEAPDHSADEDDEKDGDEDDKVKIITEKSKHKSSLDAAPKKKTMKASGPLAESWLKDIGQDEEKKTNKGWLQAPRGSSKKAAVASDDLSILKPVSASTSAQPSARQPEKAKTIKDTSSSTTNTNGWTTIPHPNNLSPSDNEAEEGDDSPSNPVLTSSTALSLQQRAFAGDDVEAAFQQEKADQAASEDEKETSTHLPGWGSWTGNGLSKSIRKANARAKHNPLFKTKLAGIKPEDRKDFHLDRVIISQKGGGGGVDGGGGVVRKGKKYLATQLPHEFQTKEQYERSRRMPVGPEWTTKEVHQRMTRPRVVVRKGVNVEALSRPGI